MAALIAAGCMLFNNVSVPERVPVSIHPPHERDEQPGYTLTMPAPDEGVLKHNPSMLSHPFSPVSAAASDAPGYPDLSTPTPLHDPPLDDILHP